jgi:hypothetical protein
VDTETPPPENTKPPYYGTVDTRADNPCNLVAESNINENWTIGDFVGLDNDGDGVYDGADSDCAVLPECPDADGDGYVVCNGCTVPEGKSCGDCDDTDPVISRDLLRWRG